ncbi:hypothetical protein CRG98_018936 [Punica granatum]|uniref:Uncharacterized protein n=1 Tax=Punica granatum TaxID=22663 RepID=A0A2I0JWI8_PUNGR|nr:hypothetical protein CRG98_018936 [Punica granatum]
MGAGIKVWAFTIFGDTCADPNFVSLEPAHMRPIAWLGSGDIRRTRVRKSRHYLSTTRGSRVDRTRDSCGPARLRDSQTNSIDSDSQTPRLLTGIIT